MTFWFDSYKCFFDQAAQALARMELPDYSAYKANDLLADLACEICQEVCMRECSKDQREWLEWLEWFQGKISEYSGSTVELVPARFYTGIRGLNVFPQERE